MIRAARRAPFVFAFGELFSISNFQFKIKHAQTCKKSRFRGCVEVVTSDIGVERKSEIRLRKLEFALRTILSERQLTASYCNAQLIALKKGFLITHQKPQN
ncbi:hypothetical protein GCM10028808_17740 [Spirosoma migulaei]